MTDSVPTAPATGPDRTLEVPGLLNARDLGGLPTADGRRVRPGVLFRSDSPAATEHAAAGLVRAVRLRHVVDLRRGTEAVLETADWEALGVGYVRCPFVAGEADSWHARYAAYLVDRPETVVAALRAVIDPGLHPVLFHCAAGKDRTGVLAALLLRLLGVSEDDVVADYLASIPAVPGILARLRGVPVYDEMLGADTDADQMPQEENMRGVLAWLEEHGGAERWLLDHGVPQVEIDTVRREVLEG